MHICLGKQYKILFVALFIYLVVMVTVQISYLLVENKQDIIIMKGDVHLIYVSIAFFSGNV